MMLNEMTIKQYADSRGKSVQSVYQQMNRKRIKDTIKEHIKEIVINNKPTKILDSIAIELLDNSSNTSVQIIEQDSKQRELEEALKQIEQLKYENEQLKNKLLDNQEIVIKMQNSLLEAPKQQETMLIELKDTLKENTELKEELSKYKKTIFGLYKKR